MEVYLESFKRALDFDGTGDILFIYDDFVQCVIRFAAVGYFQSGSFFKFIPARKHFVDFYGTTPSTFNRKEDTEDKK